MLLSRRFKNMLMRNDSVRDKRVKSAISIRTASPRSWPVNSKSRLERHAASPKHREIFSLIVAVLRFPSQTSRRSRKESEIYIHTLGLALGYNKIHISVYGSFEGKTRFRRLIFFSAETKFSLFPPFRSMPNESETKSFDPFELLCSLFV